MKNKENFHYESGSYPFPLIDVLDALPILVSIHDRQFRIIFMNKTFKRFFPKATIGQKCYCVVHEEDNPPSYCPLQQTLLDKKSHKKIFIHEKLGRQFYVQTTPLIDKDQKFIGGIHIVHDVTEAKLFEEKYLKEKSISEFVFEKAPGGIAFVINRKFFKVNEAFEELTGYSRNELIGKSTEMLFKDKKTFEKFGEIAYQILNNQGFFQTEGSLRKKDGNLISVRASCRKIEKFGQKDEMAYIWIIEDLSREKELEEAKNQLMERLNRAQRLESLGVLASGIAHDFNNILTPIMGYTELAQCFSNDERIGQYLNTISKATSKAKELIDNLLKFSKGFKDELSRVDVSECIKDTVKLLEGIVPSSVIIKTAIEDVPYKVKCTPGQMNEILMNLCTNAIHAMDEKGEMEIGCKLIILDNESLKDSSYNVRPGNFIKLWVSDTGCGMDEKIIGRIFDPYFTTKGPHKGTGLGLAMVNNIVKESNGFIKVKSSPGNGTTFEIFMPAYGGEKEEDIGQCEECKKEKCLEGIKILLVDDEESVLMISEEFLKVAGATIKTFSNPLSALEAVKKGEFIPDILITDLTMPNMTGDILAERMQELIPGLPVIIITGWGHQEGNIGEKFSVVKKPFRLRELASLITKLLKSKKISN